MMRYDIIIVGSGPGGYVAAIRAAQLGKKTALVERAEPGGVCLNWGCIPTKALLKSAQVYGYCKNAEHYGLELAGEVRPNLEAIVARSRSVAETMSKGVRFLLNKNKIDLIPGFGRLTAPGRIDVDGAEYEADHIVLATGARPREMAFMPIDGEHVISSRQALTLTRLPESMIVVGSGAIGSEFAWFYAALGVRVTIVEYMPRTGNDIGVVDCVLGMFNYRLKFYGQTTHAGTFPMPKRRDAFFAASQALCYLHEEIDKLGYSDLVYTTGEVVCHPCVHTCVPDFFDFSFDSRHEDPKVLEKVLAIVKSCEEKTWAGCTCKVEKAWNRDTVYWDKKLVSYVKTSAEECGIKHQYIHSGAGHDAQFAAYMLPTAVVHSTASSAR